ncbi:MAG: DUF4389 domain-containing protein [Chloroflexi bacterium]|nr:MAG: DUF4389 domain-containing protein [Chloroflexota bacterium]
MKIYPARLTIDRPETLDRVTTLLRFLWIIPIAVILALVSGDRSTAVTISETGERVRTGGTSIVFSIAAATALMLLFRQRYPRWWFDFQIALARFSYRVAAYALLLRDEYPSTEDEQAVHLELDYPDAKRLSNWLPLVKWILAIPHYIVLAFLLLGVVVAVVIAWFAILIGGRYPRSLFDYVVGVGRWFLRVQAYAIYLVTDRYPPFSLS